MKWQRRKKKRVSERRDNRIRKCVRGLLILTVSFLLLLSACSLPGNADSTTLAADEYGKLTETIVEHRDEGFTEEELRTYIEESIRAYAGGAEEAPVTLDSCKVSGESVRIVLKYASVADYSAFNGVRCFQGTLREAAEAGYDMEQTFYDSEGTEAPAETLQERAGEWKVLIVEEPIFVKVPDKILYTSENVTITGRLQATVDTVLNEEHQSEEYVEYSHVSDMDAYIIYK